MIILGIDPGRSGGVAMLSANNDTGKLRCEPSLFKLDLEEKAISDLFWKLFYDAQQGCDWIAAVLEKVHAMPAINRIKSRDGEIKRQEVFASVSSVGTFIQNYGFLRGCLRTVGIPFLEVRPQDWQKALGCLTRGDKNVSKRRAQELYPQFPDLRITHATADALLLAEFGRRTHKSWTPGSPATGPTEMVTIASMSKAVVSSLAIQNGDAPF